MQTLPAVDRRLLRYQLAITADGQPATIATARWALLPIGDEPTAATTWHPTTVTDGVAELLVAGPDADPTDAVVLPAGKHRVWVQIADNPETITQAVDTVAVY